MKRTGLFITTVLLTVSILQAGSESGADFLKIPVGARSMGMGQAASALAEGADAVNWNVAGIVPFQPGIPGRYYLSLSHEQLFFENQLNHLALTRPYKNFGFGFSVLRLSHPDQEARDATGTRAGSFGASDMALGVSFASAWKGMRVGTQVKMIRQELASESASGVALDLGFQTRTRIPSLRLGASVRNWGPRMTFVDEAYHLPLTLSLGAAVQVLNPLVVTMDVNSFQREGKTELRIGTEFEAHSSFALRAGYIAQLANSISNNQKNESNRGNFGGIAGINAGVGLQLTALTLDYAFSPFGELGDIHTFTLSTAFGGASKSSQATSPANTTPSAEQPGDRTIIQFDQPDDEDWWQNNKKVPILQPSNPHLK